MSMSQDIFWRISTISCQPGSQLFPVVVFQWFSSLFVCVLVSQQNKAECQSFGGIIGLDLTDDCFAHGQLFLVLYNTMDPKNFTALSHKYVTLKKLYTINYFSNNFSYSFYLQIIFKLQLLYNSRDNRLIKMITICMTWNQLII